MTNLPIKTERDDLGVSFWERAIIYAALLLKSSYTAPSKESDIAVQGLTPVKIAVSSKAIGTSLVFYCELECRIPFNAPLAHELGGDYSGAVKEILKGSPLAWKGKSLSLLTSEGFSVTPGGSGLPSDPPWVTSLEKYLVWCVEQRIKELLSSNPTSVPLTITPLEESTTAELLIKASIPINYSYYLANHSLIGSTLPISLIPGSGGGGIQIRLDDLSDVVIGTSQPANNFALVSDGTRWIARALTAITGGVTSINGQTGVVSLIIPTLISQLINDANFVTAAQAAAAAPVQSVNGQTGAVNISVASVDWASVQNKPTIVQSVNGQTGAVLIPELYSLTIALSDETTNVTAGSSKFSGPLFFPDGFATLTIQKLFLSANSVSGNLVVVDVNKNDVSILSTKLSIDVGELTSATAASPFVLATDPTTYSHGNWIKIDVDSVGTCTGLKVHIIGVLHD